MIQVEQENHEDYFSKLSLIKLVVPRLEPILVGAIGFIETAFYFKRIILSESHKRMDVKNYCLQFFLTVGRDLHRSGGGGGVYRGFLGVTDISILAGVVRRVNEQRRRRVSYEVAILELRFPRCARNNKNNK